MKGLRLTARSLLAALLLAALSACPVGIALYTDYTFLHDGKTYVVQDFSFDGTQNVTLYEVVDGERKHRGFVDEEDLSFNDLRTKPIPEEKGHKRTIMIVIQQGEQQGEPTTRHQESLRHPIDALGE